jgi:hypothetical protein
MGDVIIQQQAVHALARPGAASCQNDRHKGHTSPPPHTHTHATHSCAAGWCPSPRVAVVSSSAASSRCTNASSPVTCVRCVSASLWVGPRPFAPGTDHAHKRPERLLGARHPRCRWQALLADAEDARRGRACARAVGPEHQVQPLHVVRGGDGRRGVHLGAVVEGNAPALQHLHGRRLWAAAAATTPLGGVRRRRAVVSSWTVLGGGNPLAPSTPASADRRRAAPLSGCGGRRRRAAARRHHRRAVGVCWR